MLTSVIVIFTAPGAASAGTESADSRAQGSTTARVSAPDVRWPTVPLRAALQAAGLGDRTGRCPPNTKPVPSGCIPRSAAHVVYGERCRSARLATAFYRQRTWDLQAERGGELADRTPIVRGKTCRWARYATGEHRARARSAGRALKRWRRVLSNPTAAICHVFGAYCSQALRVASCESGRGTQAQNGQYLGMFQMGDYARSRYGHSSTALGQARSAYAYFVASGRDWSPWSCKPW